MSASVGTEIEISEDAPRQVNLVVARVDPWTVMKVGFLLSVAMGIATVIATIVVWAMLDGMHVFSSIEDFLNQISATKFVALLDYVKLPKVVSYATVFSVANVIIMTAISTLGALLYNVIASLVGGVRVSLMDE